MRFYERFEQLVALALSLILIFIALMQLYKRVLPLVWGGVLNPLDHEVLQSLFG